MIDEVIVLLYSFELLTNSSSEVLGVDVLASFSFDFTQEITCMLKTRREYLPTTICDPIIKLKQKQVFLSKHTPCCIYVTCTVLYLSLETNLYFPKGPSLNGTAYQQLVHAVNPKNFQGLFLMFLMVPIPLNLINLPHTLAIFCSFLCQGAQPFEDYQKKKMFECHYWASQSYLVICFSMHQQEQRKLTKNEHRIPLCHFHY